MWKLYLQDKSYISVCQAKVTQLKRLMDSPLGACRQANSLHTSDVILHY